MVDGNRAGLSYSARVVEPFLQVVAESLGQSTEQAAKQLARMAQRERVAISAAHRMLQDAIELTGDPAIGLKAGRSRGPGDGGALEYAIHSTGTVREAIAVAARYTRLVNDALSIQVELQAERAIVRLDNHLALPPGAEDYLVAVMYTLHMRRLLEGAGEVECWFAQPAPPDRAEHDRTFAPARLRFGAPCSGFAFASSGLDNALPSADSTLHAILIQHAERVLAELPPKRSVALDVRKRIADMLPAGQPTVTGVARKLGMSTRTLSRRLEAEAESFTGLLDDTRRRLALRHLDADELSIEEIAFLLGFSQAPVFHRAFRRWTGTTPLEYRRAQRREPAAPPAPDRPE